MAKSHGYSEYIEITVFEPVHDFIWNTYLINSTIDGQMAFYYAMEYISKRFFWLDAKTAFEVASDIMQETWDLYYSRMEEECKAEETIANNYEAWTEDDLPW